MIGESFVSCYVMGGSDKINLIRFGASEQGFLRRPAPLKSADRDRDRGLDDLMTGGGGVFLVLVGSRKYPGIPPSTPGPQEVFPISIHWPHIQNP